MIFRTLGLLVLVILAILYDLKLDRIEPPPIESGLSMALLE